MESTEKTTGRSALNIFLLLLTVVVFVLIWAMKADPTKRNVDLLPNMVTSIAYDALDPNPNFPDGKTMREPVPGTIPVGRPVLHYTASKEDALRAGEELRNPFSVVEDAKALDRGMLVYQTFCQVCHGAGGLGDGPVSKRGYPPPPSLLAEHAVAMKDGQMFHLQTYGQGNMPSYEAQISREDRWRAILHIRALQRNARQAPSPLPTDTTGKETQS